MSTSPGSSHIAKATFSCLALTPVKHSTHQRLHVIPPISMTRVPACRGVLAMFRRSKLRRGHSCARDMKDGVQMLPAGGASKLLGIRPLFCHSSL